MVHFRRKAKAALVSHETILRLQSSVHYYEKWKNIFQKVILAGGEWREVKGAFGIA
jgi:hypothetical protein